MTKTDNHGSKQPLMPSLLDGGNFSLGIVVGGSTVLLFCLWISIEQITGPKDSTLFGAIIGGLLAGGAALVSTLLANYFLLKEAKARSASEMEAIAASCFQKLHFTRDTFLKAYRHYLDGSDDNVVRYGLPGEPMRQVPKPLSFSSIERRLTDDELRLPISLKEVHLFNLLGDLDNYVYSYNSLSNAYQDQFNRLQELMIRSPAADFRGRQISSPGVEIHPVDILAVEDLRDLLVDCVQRGLEAATNAHSEIIRVLGSQFGRTIEFAEDPNMPGHVSYAPSPRY